MDKLNELGDQRTILEEVKQQLEELKKKITNLIDDQIKSLEEDNPLLRVVSVFQKF